MAEETETVVTAHYNQDPNANGKTTLSLAERAAMLTEHRHPQTKQAAAANNAAGAGSFWDQESEPAQTPVQQNNQVQDPNQKKDPAYTRARANASADITTMSIDNAQRLIFSLLENWRFKNKFKAHEIKKIDAKDLTGYTKRSELPLNMPEDEKTLWNKWHNLYAKHEKKLGKIPMIEREKQSWHEMLVALQEYNQKILSPTWGISLNAINLVANRCMEIYMED